MDTIIHPRIVRFPSTVLGYHCEVTVSMEDSINLETGDSVALTTIAQIREQSEGQLIHTRTLSMTEFKGLVQQARSR